MHVKILVWNASQSSKHYIKSFFLVCNLYVNPFGCFYKTIGQSFGIATYYNSLCWMCTNCHALGTSKLSVKLTMDQMSVHWYACVRGRLPIITFQARNSQHTFYRRVQYSLLSFIMYSCINILLLPMIYVNWWVFLKWTSYYTSVKRFDSRQTSWCTSLKKGEGIS